ncbi:signal recognition particle protein [Candidatus Gromoviella agglomerans]|uniref:signal recognition particle protein n=1 Tax=Candidatus Gromoviella agglomerans TaxID=2806609 RepID=UPI001E2CE6DE|nr:signal recognition particle receptor subunit alpha [Candidatus Gromoviella agglomerans]
MFSSLSQKLTSIISKMRTKGVLKHSDLESSVQDIKMCLLEADVSLSVVNKLITTIVEKATGTKKIANLMPVHILLKILKDEIIHILSENNRDIDIQKGNNIMLVGLQGSGKTTSCVKLAKFLKNMKTLIVSVDTYRPAAIEQLSIIAKLNHIEVFESDSTQPITRLKDALSYKKLNNYDVMIIDTAGRTQLDNQMMEEIKHLADISNPSEIILVADSATGQDILTITEGFSKFVNLTGFILSRADADNRGGAALSLSYETKKPIFFVGIGEKASDIAEFKPDRIASQILGQGDIMSLVEKAITVTERETQLELENNMRSGKFDLNDMKKQFSIMKKMGGLSGILAFMPEIGITDNVKQQGQNLMKKMGSIIDSMTPKERSNPSIINASRKTRIAKGSGTHVSDVNNLLKKHEHMRKMMKTLSAKTISKMK